MQEYKIEKELYYTERQREREEFTSKKRTLYSWQAKEPTVYLT